MRSSPVRARPAKPGADTASAPEEIVLRTRRADLAGRTPRQHDYLDKMENKHGPCGRQILKEGLQKIEALDINNQGDLYAKLPLGAATLGGRVEGGDR